MSDSEREPSVLITQLVFPFLLIVITAAVQGAISYYFMREQGIESARSAEQASELQTKNIEIQLDVQEKAINAKFERQMELIEARSQLASEEKELEFNQREDLVALQKFEARRSACLQFAAEATKTKKSILEEITTRLIDFRNTHAYGWLNPILAPGLTDSKEPPHIVIIRAARKRQTSHIRAKLAMIKIMPFFSNKKNERSIKVIELSMLQLQTLNYEGDNKLNYLIGKPDDIIGEKLLEITLLINDEIIQYDVATDKLLVDLANEIATSGKECIDAYN